MPWAAIDLARASESGRGVPAERADALVWYAIALGMGDDATVAQAVSDATSDYSDAERVSAAQLLLSRLGIAIAPVDGSLGPGTRAALAEAFAAHGETAPDGVPTIETLARLTAFR